MVELLIHEKKKKEKKNQAYFTLLLVYKFKFVSFTV